MSPFPSELEATVSVQAEPGISSLMIAIVGYGAVFIFIAIIISLRVAARKTSCCPPPSRSPASSDHGHSSPFCLHYHRPPPAQRGLALPTASLPRHFECQGAYTKPADTAARISQGSVHSPAPLPPYYAKRAPTGIQHASPQRPASSAAASVTTTHGMPLGYTARGPTATLRPTVW